MKAVWAVIVDLFNFVRGRDPLFLTVQEDRDRTLLLEEASTLIADAEAVIDSVLALPEPASSTAPGDGLDDDTLLAVTLYITVPESLVYREPFVKLDASVASLYFGTRCGCDEIRGEMIRVLIDGEVVGWIPRTQVTDESRAVLPHFTAMQYYGADHPDTQKLRWLLSDAWRGGVAGLPLSDAELVAFRLKQRNLSPRWPVVHEPRVAGKWGRILAEVIGVRMVAMPKMGSVMEWKQGATWQLGFVEAVLPDESCRISTVTDGVYEERVMTKPEWEVLEPVFIVIT